SFADPGGRVGGRADLAALRAAKGTGAAELPGRAHRREEPGGTAPSGPAGAAAGGRAGAAAPAGERSPLTGCSWRDGG
ncbi:MAG: hypothetical protein DIU76_06255, partial [Bacillota bacterium]